MQAVTETNSSFIDFLSGKMIQYRLENTDNSYNKIKLYSGFNYRTLKKVENKSIVIDNLDPIKLTRLIKLINNETSLENVINKFKEQINFELTGITSLRTTLSSFDKFEEVNIDLEKELDSYEKLKVYSLACNHIGTTRRQIKNIYNEKSLNSLEELLENGILKEKSGKIFQNSSKNYVNFSKKIIRDNYGKLFEELDIEGIDFRHFLSGMSESYNEKGIMKILKILTKTLKEIQEVSENKELLGNLPYHLTLGFGSYIKSKGNLIEDVSSIDSNEVIQ